MMKLLVVAAAMLLPTLTWAHEPEAQDPLLRATQLRQEARRAAFDAAQLRRDRQLETIGLRQARPALLAHTTLQSQPAVPSLDLPEYGRTGESPAAAGGAWHDGTRSQQ